MMRRLLCNEASKKGTSAPQSERASGTLRLGHAQPAICGRLLIWPTYRDPTQGLATRLEDLDPAVIDFAEPLSTDTTLVGSQRASGRCSDTGRCGARRRRGRRGQRNLTKDLLHLPLR